MKLDIQNFFCLIIFLCGLSKRSIDMGLRSIQSLHPIVV